MKKEFLEKIANKDLKVGVVGLGYVGLPLAVEKAISGYKTVGFEVSQEKADMINNKENYIQDVDDKELADMVDQGMLRATTDYSQVADLEFIAIAVPTPLDRYHQPDISYIEDSATSIGKHMTRGTVVVLESTTYPGTTEEVLKPILEKESGLKCGEDFYLAFSPERVDPGNAKFKTRNTPKVVGGVGQDATEIVSAFYKSVLDAEVYPVSDPKVAEMEKILENTYRNVNIGLVNEFAKIADAMGINIWEVVDAAKTKPYGFQAFYPGPGIGGHCIPLDPFYLTWKAREYDEHMPIVEASSTVNDSMPQYVITRMMRFMSRKAQKALAGSKVLVMGIAYKGDIDDLRDSPALEIIEKLGVEGARVDYFDELNPEFVQENGTVKKGLEDISPEIVSSYDIVLITTKHSTVDYQMVVDNAKLVLDTRYATKGIKADNLELL